MGSMCAVVYFKWVELISEEGKTENMEKLTEFSTQEIMQEIFVRGVFCISLVNINMTLSTTFYFRKHWKTIL